MSFNFNPMASSMQQMHLLAPNTAGNFLPKMLAQQTAQMTKNSVTHHYDFAVSSGNGPMELENVADHNEGCDHHNEGCENGSSNSEMMFNGMIPQSFMMLPGVMMDPSMLQFPILNMPSATVTSADNSPTKISENSIAKEIIHCPSCTLIPPNPNQLPPTTRERPLGCKTCFVGGLPENITQEIIQEIFERCGEITTLRLSKKNFCHIRFAFEASVDSAIYLSGYRVKIGNNNDPGNTGKLHVDYAQARDDQYEFECRQRQFQREQRHKEKDRSRSSSSPPLVIHYTDHEANSVSEKIKNDETFLKAVSTLVAWLERGDCSKKNANIFYSMIQSTNSHIRRLLNEKCQFEDELRDAKEKYHKQMVKMIEQFDQIEKVFNAASHKKVRDHLTKAQRRNIDNWCKQATEVRSFQLHSADENDDEMDLSDDENTASSSKRARIDKTKKKDESHNNQYYDIKFEDDLKESRSDSELKNKQIKVLQETIRNLQRKLIETSTKEKQNEAKISELEESIRDSNVKELLLRTKIANKRTNSLSVTNDDASETSSVAPVNILDSRNHEPQIISLATAFLVIHPQGAEIELILGYVWKFVSSVGEDELLDVLTKNEKLFTVVDIDNVQLWFYCGFKSMP